MAMLLLVSLMLLATECHRAAWWISVICHSGQVFIAGASWHRPGWHCTWCAMHNRNAQFFQGIDVEGEELCLIFRSRFLCVGSWTWIGHPGVQRHCFLKTGSCTTLNLYSVEIEDIHMWKRTWNSTGPAYTFVFVHLVQVRSRL